LIQPPVWAFSGFDTGSFLLELAPHSLLYAVRTFLPLHTQGATNLLPARLF